MDTSADSGGSADREAERPSADREAERPSAEPERAADDSESGATAEDSSGDDDVYSDLEYSRVIPSPATDVRGSRSTPKTPRGGMLARNVLSETPTAVRQRANDTQTQTVPPVTATQLQRLGLGFAESLLDDAAPSPDAVEKVPSSAHRRRSERSERDDNEVDAAADAPLLGLIESDDERISSGSEGLGTPHVAQLGSASYGSGGVVDETPMRYQPFAGSRYVYILSLWHRKWYPARAERHAFEEARLSSAGTRTRASVTFADGTTDMTDLSQAIEFDLQVGDRVQVEQTAFRGKKFEVVHLISDDSVTDLVRTTSGHSMARLRMVAPARGAASHAMIVVATGELSLAKSDFDLWTQVRACAPDLSNHERDGHERDVHGSPTDHRLARLARSKRQRRLDSADADVAVRPARRRKIGAAAAATTAVAAAATVPALSAASPPKHIFSNCIFSISMSDQAGDESEEIRQLITANGGTVLASGLSEVVRLTEATQSGDMPSHELDLGDAEFAAVLAEKPRRTIKYLEMLAVGWPCLMSGFIKACIDENNFVDWVPWTLPAGPSSVQRKAGAFVSANITQFQYGWLRGEKLAAQFLKRRIILKCTIPICVVIDPDHRDRGQEIADMQRLFLASLCAPQYKLWVYDDHVEVPSGALLLQLGEKKGQKSVESDPRVLHEMKNLAAASDVVVKDASWLLECIINGELI